MRLLLIALGLLLSSFACHKFYVSTTLINHNELNQTLEFTIKIFTDDLEMALMDDEESPLRLGDVREVEDADARIESYFREKIGLSVNGVKQNMMYLGKEVEMDLTYCYLEVSGVPDFTIMEFTNEILFEHFEEQTNVIELKSNGSSQKIALTSQQSVAIFP